MNRFRITSFLSVAVASVVAAGVQLAPNTAEACGGTFCDNGPNAMPVDQTGENIIFLLEDDKVEAHIQIAYDPEAPAENFAWVIPVMSIPEFEVGSEILFDNILAATVPTYGFNQQFDECSADDDGGFSTAASATGGGDDGAGESDSGEGGGPEVVFEETVGAFDIVVLQGGTVSEVMDWLAAEGYQQDPSAEPILEEYLAEGFLFTAMKLTNNAETEQIHPIVIRTDGNEPCVPLRLTRIAAQEDMDVRVFFLGDDRVVPTNYRHVLVNPLKIDWINFAANYKDVITMAVDADSADGNAFVTEYAGNDANIQTWNLYEESWNETPINALTDSPVGLIEILQDQNQLYCFGEFCEWYHPLIQGIVRQYVPVPDGMDEAEFYSCLSCVPELIDTAAWNADEFATAYRDRIIDPGLHARTIVEQNTYVTRMYTTISDVEMNVDPIFEANPDLEDVTNIRQATMRNHCDGSATMDLPDGREVYLPDPSTWPDIAEEEMPFEEDIERGVTAGPLMNLVDRTEEIDALLAEWNAQRGGEEGTGEGDDTGESSEGTANANDEGGSASGCGCEVTDRSPMGAAGFLGLVGLLGLRRRRR